MGIVPKDLKSIRNELGIQIENRVWIGGHHLEAKKLIATLYKGISKPATGQLDSAIITPISADEAAYFAQKLHDRLIPNGNIWVVVEEKTSLDVQVEPQSANTTTAQSVREALANVDFQSTKCVLLNENFKAMEYKSSQVDES